MFMFTYRPYCVHGGLGDFRSFVNGVKEGIVVLDTATSLTLPSVARERPWKELVTN